MLNNSPRLEIEKATGFSNGIQPRSRRCERRNGGWIGEGAKQLAAVQRGVVGDSGRASRSSEIVEGSVDEREHTPVHGFRAVGGPPAHSGHLRVPSQNVDEHAQPGLLGHAVGLEDRDEIRGRATDAEVF
jgi:hypothetical protein